ncbi:hypothetical protein V1506DRAFT_550595 [Lipomyces tetrasporus]
MTCTNKKRSHVEATWPSQFMEPLEEDTITVSSPPPPLPREERLDTPLVVVQKTLSILCYLSHLPSNPDQSL